ncbi:hypothetical protein [Brevibacterium sp. RIT 803]|uniref:hypothetical protein n=1 Tax=Brevibacterium sp. RIT 803 TaxID=2810210 RepID=UPI00194E23E2|nr:hypothetical protein [Brevibacterium sp. RIT 803]MBM6589857.1 hypothetical protein [Brevibacterium sp. RIT 803]
MNTRITDDHPDLTWANIDQLEVGEWYATSVESPLSYMLIGTATGRGGRTEYDIVCPIGAGRKPSLRTFWKPGNQLIVIPPEHVGQRLTDAAIAFAEKERQGLSRITLSPESWPNCLAEGNDDAEVSA